jgi:hypothetical protein
MTERKGLQLIQPETVFHPSTPPRTNLFSVFTYSAKKEPPPKKDGGCSLDQANSIRVALKSVAVVLLLFGLAAIRAALGFVGQTLFLVKFLFAFGEHEFFRAVFANQCLIWHGFLLCVWDI